MKKKKIYLRPYMEPVVCGCGGLYLKAVNDTILLCNPPRKSFKCSVCKCIVTLREEDWPIIKYEEV